MLHAIKMPSFKLYNPSTREWLTNENLPSDSRCTVICIICNHCPFVTHVRDKIFEVQQAFLSQKVYFFAVSVNDPSQYPDDSPEQIAAHSKKYNFPFPYLYDESQQIARDLGAECTPDFFVFGRNHEMRYHGRLDQSTPRNAFENNGCDLIKAIDHVLIDPSGISLEEDKPSIGCSIKWSQ